MISLRGTTVFVTVGDEHDRVGASVARLLAPAGAEIVIAGPAESGHVLAQEIRASGERVRFLQTDLRDLVDIAHAVDRAGAVDIAIVDAANFASPAPAAPAADDGLDAWYETTFSALVLSCAFLPSMALRGGGRIIHIDTAPAVDAGDTPAPDYAAKLAKLTLKWSERWASHGVRVHSVAPTRTSAHPGHPTDGTQPAAEVATGTVTGWTAAVAETVVSLAASDCDGRSGDTYLVPVPTGVAGRLHNNERLTKNP